MAFKMFIKIRYALLAFSIFMGSDLALASVKSSLELKCSTKEISLGDSFEVKLELRVLNNEDVKGIGQPDFEGAGFQIENQSRSTSSSYRNINGRSERSKTYVFSFLLKALRTGALTLPRASAKINGETIFSKSHRIKIVESSSDDLEYFPNKPFFMRAVLSQNSVFIGEQVYLELKIYAQESIRVQDIDFPKMQDFWVEKVDDDRMEGQRQIIQGREYTVFSPYKAVIFPLKDGKITIPTAAMTVEVQRGFFSRGRTYVLKSKAVELEVQSLPSEGRPGAFNESNIGEWNFSVQLEKQSTEVGQAVKLEMKIRGKGRVSALSLPSIEGALSNVRTFPPNHEEKSQIQGEQLFGEKKVTMLIQPLKEGYVLIPSFEFNFFNPRSGVFETRRSKEMRLEVKARNQALTQGNSEKSKGASEKSQRKNTAKNLKLRPLHLGEELELFSSNKASIKWWMIALFALALTWLRVVTFQLIKRKKSEKYNDKAVKKEFLEKVKLLSKVSVSEQQVVFWEVLSLLYGDQIRSKDASTLQDFLIEHSCKRELAKKAASLSKALQQQLYSQVSSSQEHLVDLQDFLSSILKDAS